jgi:hypothetical protein
MNVHLPGTGTVPIRRQEGGFCVEGPGFYVWDEDPREVSRVARLLGRGVYPEHPTQRLLIVAPPESGGVDG